MKFDGRILVIGLGAISRCALQLLVRHLEMDPRRITVIDYASVGAAARSAEQLGINFVSERVTEQNYAELLGRYLGRGDVLIDLGYSIGLRDVLLWAQANGVRMLTTCIEEWSLLGDRRRVPREAPGLAVRPPVENSLYRRYTALREQVLQLKGTSGPTALIDHGANPGLVSHFVKRALNDITAHWLEEHPHSSERRDRIVDALGRRRHNELAQHLGVKVIHVSERDTQISSIPRREGEFVGTWSIKGMWSECFATAEVTWGTHERSLPERATRPDFGPQHQLIMASFGDQTLVKSWVPCGEILGMVIRHGECFTIGDHLTVMKGDQVVYRPTVNYAYCPCDATIASLHELHQRSYLLQRDQRIMNDDIVDGRDELGVLLMGHDFTSWWTGSVLDIHQTRALAASTSATALQVAAGVLSGVVWLIRHPNEGVHLPDDLPHEEVLEAALPYLGAFQSRQVDWTPLKNRVRTFDGYGVTAPPEDDVWQFNSFLHRP